MTQLNYVETLTAVVIGILSVARTARLLVWDEYPPTMWLRMKWDDMVGESAWGTLLHCQYCLGPYLAAGMAGWAYLSDLHWTWWVINGVWGFSYVSSIIVSYDQPDG